MKFTGPLSRSVRGPEWGRSPECWECEWTWREWVAVPKCKGDQKPWALQGVGTWTVLTTP